MDENYYYNYFRGNDEVDIQAEHRLRVLYQVNVRYYLRDTMDPFAMSVSEFKRLYRLPQHMVMDLVRELAPLAADRINERHVPIEIKVLCALSFYASGSYQRILGRNSDVSLSQSTVSNVVEEVTTLLNHPRILARFIHFPTTHLEREETMEINSRLGMPRVLGYIDGTLVKIVPPSWENNREAYFCRKGYTAINVQIVCDARLRILDINARFPGSCNDSFIYRESGMRDEMMRAYEESHCWLLGDSGYPHEPWLQIPLPHAIPGTPEYFYTLLHCFCRNVVERCNGVLKEVWRCMLNDRTLHYSPVKAGMICNACAVLHNFCRENNLPIDLNAGAVDVADHANFDEEAIENAVYAVGRRLRQLAEQERRFLINHAFVNAQ